MFTPFKKSAARSLTFVITVAIAAALLVSVSTQIVADDRLFDEIIVFGHSDCDNGNDYILTEGLACPPPYSAGRFSNGPIWVEWLAHRLGFRRPTEKRFYPSPSLAGGTNYAFGGAESGPGYSNTCVVLKDGTRVCIPNVGLQIEMFLGSRGVGAHHSDDLFVLLAGSNDSSPVIAARNMGDHIAELAEAGGKVFLVSNESRSSQSPGNAHGGPGLDNFVAKFNAELAVELDALEAAYDITIIRFDLLGLHDQMINNPKDFGLTNVTDAACPGCGFGIPQPGAENTLVPNPDEYMYWDQFHFTRVVHKIVGNAAADLILNGP